MSEQTNHDGRHQISLPAPTAWPLLFAFGLTFGLAGLVTHVIVTMVGVVLVLVSARGWWWEVLPHEREVEIEVPARLQVPVARALARVDHLQLGEAGHRMRLPAQVHSISEGWKAGLVGGAAMAATGALFGIVSHTSIWYPVNLLAAGALPSLATADQATLEGFLASGLIVGGIIHLSLSLMVGVLYAALLPIFPRHPAIVGGVLAPLLWSALIWASLGIVNPQLNQRIEWFWFVASQLAFGLTAGFVVHRSEKIATMQTWSLAERTGIEAGGDAGGEA